MITSRDDVAYWGLTHTEAAHHYGRLARMHAKRARHHADLAARYARQAEIAGWISMVAGGIAVGLAVAALMVGA